MILPKDMCEQISYYEVDYINLSGRMYDRVTIHFKQWWKRKKTIDIARKEMEDREGWWTRSQSCTELLNLLDSVVRDSWTTHKVTSEEDNVVSVDFNKDKKC